MNTTELKNKIVELEKDFTIKQMEFLDKLAELKSAIAEQGKKPGRWVPGHGENYYFKTAVDDIGQTIVAGTTVDKSRVNSGNCFQTRQEAEAHQLIAVPKGDVEQMLWMVDYLRAGDGGDWELWVYQDGSLGYNRCFNVTALPRWPTESKAREWVESHGGEAEVTRRLLIGWPK